jgi:hypothetical protein
MTILPEFEERTMKALSELLVKNATEADASGIPTDEYYSMWMTILVIQVVSACRYTDLLPREDLIKFVADVVELVYGEESIAEKIALKH